MKFQSLNTLVFGFIGLAGLLGGCAAQPNQDEITSRYWRAKHIHNGLKLNGIQAENGVGVNGIGVNGIGVNGVGVNGIAVDKGVLFVVQNNNRIEGNAFVGAKLKGFYDYENDPTDFMTMQITGYTPASGSTPALYNILDLNLDPLTGEPYEGDPPSSPRLICGLDENNEEIPVVMFNGTWDSYTGAWTTSSTQFTMACANASIGKCGLWYYPELSKREYNGVAPSPEPEDCSATATVPCKERSLRPWHAACLRMVRADYCGDSAPHTTNGTLINIWDGVGIEAHGESITNFTPEAEWGVDGAHCIMRTRYHQANPYLTPDLDYIRAQETVVGMVTNYCGSRLYHWDRPCTTDSHCGGATDSCLPGGYCQCTSESGQLTSCKGGFTCETDGHCRTQDPMCLDEADSSFYTVHGFDVASENRRLLRNETGINTDPQPE